jgi:hypothetical protein
MFNFSVFLLLFFLIIKMALAISFALRDMALAMISIEAEEPRKLSVDKMIDE